MIGNAFILALRQVIRNPMRSLLTVLGVVIGVAAVITMVSVGEGTSIAIREQIESFGNNQLLIRPGQRLAPGQFVRAPAFSLESVRAIEKQIGGVEAAVPQVKKALSIVANGKNWSSSVVGTENAFFKVDNRSITEGRLFSDLELRAGAASCVIGQTIQSELFGDEESVGKSLRVGNFSCKIVGVMKPKGSSSMGGDLDDIVLMPLEAVQRRIKGNTKVDNILVKVADNSDSQRVKSAIKTFLRDERKLSTSDMDNFMILDTAEIAEKVASTTNMMTLLLTAVAAVSLVVGGIGIMNIMLVSVTERTREIGIRLAIGAFAREVLMQFLIESLVLGCFGGLIGIAFGQALILLITHYMEVPYVLNIGVNLLAFGVAAMTGVVFGYFPARRAANMDPIEAVRHE